MCDAQDTMPTRGRIRVRERDRRKCMRCDQESRFVVREITHCERCFLSSVQLKLTRGINAPLLQAGGQRGNATVRPRAVNGGVVVALSGGAGSTALFDHLVARQYVARPGASYDITRGDKEPVWTHGWAVHVVFPGDDRNHDLQNVLRRRSMDAGLSYLELGAEDVFDPNLHRWLLAEVAAQRPSCLQVYVSPSRGEASSSGAESLSTDAKERLVALLGSLPPSSRPTMQQHILDALLSTVAQTLPDVKHLLVGETATREAQRIVTSTAQGRGWSLPLDLAPAQLAPLPMPAPMQHDGRSAPSPAKVTRIPAAHDVSVKEAALYCHVRGLPTYNWRRWESGRGRKDATSIEGLTERFVLTLSTRHPATVGAITRTAAKLQFVGERDVLCPLCQSPVDKDVREWKARASLTSLPERGMSLVTCDNGLSTLLCYACATTMRDVRGDPEMPLWIREREQALQPRQHPELPVTATPVSDGAMRAQIENFLLEE